MMATFREQQQQNAKLLGSIAGLLDPVRQSAPASWGSWVGTMAESFDRSLLPQFYMDSFNLVMRYQNESRQLGQPQQPAFVPQQAQQPQPQQPAFVPQQQPAFQPGDGQVYQPPPTFLQQQQQRQLPRRHSSDVVDWNTTGPTAGRPGRPSSTPATLTLSGLSDVTFSGLVGDSENVQDLHTPPTTRNYSEL